MYPREGRNSRPGNQADHSGTLRSIGKIVRQQLCMARRAIFDADRELRRAQDSFTVIRSGRAAGMDVTMRQNAEGKLLLRHATNPLRRMRVIVFLLALCAQGMGLSTRSAWAEYPDHAITIVVPFSPGGATDILARIVGAHIREKLGQSVVVVNRPGAGSNIGIAAVAKAKPDGYTFLSASDAIVVNQSLYENVPYDLMRDFAPVTDLITAPNVIYVSKNSDIKTFVQLIEIAKNNPNLLDYSTPGVGTPPNLATELLKIKANVNILHVPYPGAPPAIQAVLSGTVKFGVIALSAVYPQIKDGALQALAIMGNTRWHDLPDVPTSEDAGISIPSAAFNNAQALFAPAGTPKEIIDKISQLAIDAMKDSKTSRRLEENGSRITARGPEVLAERIAREQPMWKEIVDTVGVKVK